MRCVRIALLAGVLGSSLSTAWAVPVPTTENFDTTNQNWKNSVSNLSQNATWVNGGGPNGAFDPFIESTFTTPAMGTPGASQVVFRARDTVDSSNDIFFGNWIDYVRGVDFWFRHDAPTPLFIGLRIPTAAGFPAMLGRFPTAVDPNVWTHLTMDINATNPELLDETGPTHNNYNAVFTNITSLQVFANLSSQANSATIHFDLDAFTVVPEPGSWVMGSLGAAGVALVARARRRKMARA